MMRIVHLASRGQAERRNLVAGQPFQTNLYPALKEAATVEITGPLGPAGETVTEQVDTKAGGGKNLLVFEKTWQPGYYTYAVPQRGDVGGIFSTNPDGAESDLAEIADEELTERIGARETHVAAGFDELVKRFEETARQELWQYFLILCLVLAVAEPLLANWMRPERGRPSAHPIPARRDHEAA